MSEITSGKEGNGDKGDTGTRGHGDTGDKEEKGEFSCVHRIYFLVGMKLNIYPLYSLDTLNW
ncbi:hypothetical protein AMR41_06590 [Hapalosiphon sp. MRB220]|nr:hypothetical protein AMR41_06590 [Hapalosiphon sp. MRB220]